MAERYIGLMSGTSVNAVDAVLVEFSAASAPPEASPAPCVLAALEHPLPGPLRAQLLALTRPGPDELDRVARLDSAVARLFADAVAALLARAGVDAGAIRAIGSHGQTLRHRPEPGTADDGYPAEPYTLQIGNPSLLAELTGIVTVADFRRRDIAAGGQGAPLAPAFHRAFFAADAASQAVVNIGGIANLSILPGDPARPVSGFDSGPGNALLDAWAERCRGLPYDRDGTWAATGEVQPALLQRWLDDAFFARPPPKSTGRETLHLDWLGDLRNFRAEDIQASLVALTATSIADAVERYAVDAERVWVCGGGVHNRALMEALRRRLAPRPVRSSADAGVDPDYLEALGFAWLARQTLRGLPGNLPAVTGARGPRVLGGIYPA